MRHRAPAAEGRPPQRARPCSGSGSGGGPAVTAGPARLPAATAAERGAERARPAPGPGPAPGPPTFHLQEPLASPAAPHPGGAVRRFPREPAPPAGHGGRGGRWAMGAGRWALSPHAGARPRSHFVRAGAGTAPAPAPQPRHCAVAWPRCVCPFPVPSPAPQHSRGLTPNPPAPPVLSSRASLAAVWACSG